MKALLKLLSLFRIAFEICSYDPTEGKGSGVISEYILILYEVCEVIQFYLSFYWLFICILLKNFVSWIEGKLKGRVEIVPD